jgi:uncharacterized protein YjiS (DUF1127 family)
MTVLWKQRQAAPIGWRLVRVIWNAAGLLGAWRQQHAAERELSRLSDRLLRDIGVDGPRLRELARVEDLGLPSRNLAAAEIAQGAPARESSPVCGCSVRRWAISKQNQAGASKGCDVSSPSGWPLLGPPAPGDSRPAAAPIRLVPRGGFRA